MGMIRGLPESVSQGYKVIYITVSRKDLGLSPTRDQGTQRTRQKLLPT
jgi:hypothetical protein